MSIQELEQATLEYIRDIYCKEYIGKIRVEKLDPIGYCVYLGMDTPYQPIVIYGELEDEDFLKFLKLDLRNRSFHLVDFGELNLRES